MIYFNSDYLEGAHPALLEKLNETNMVQTVGYGEDEYCAAAREKIKAACGAPEIDVAIPLLLEEGVRNRNMPLERFAAFTATNAAKRFGLYPRKGVLAVGSDADFYLADMDTSWTFSRRNSFSKSKLDRFAHEGRTFHCRVVSTWVRGNEVYRDGQILREPGYGRMILPQWEQTE